MGDIYVNKDWIGQIRNLANQIDKSIKKQDFISTKNLILDLIELKKSGIQEVRRDASVALEHINKKYGTENPSEFISPDWRGDFRAIKRRVLITQKTNKESYI